MALPTINFREFTVDDIMEALNNSGYYTSECEFEAARDGAFKYVGFSANYHRFLIGFFDENSGDYLVSRLFVGIDARGRICADYPGCPEKDCMTREQAIEYCERVCN